MKDYLVTVKVRNNRILKAIKAIGGSPGEIWCEANGLVYQTINHFINMTLSPLLSNGQLSTQATKLCDVLNALPEDLWSPDQLNALEKNFTELELDRDQVSALIAGGAESYLQDFSKVEQEELRRDLTSIISRFSPFRRKIMELTMAGFTEADIARQFGFSKGYIHSMKQHAFATIRHRAPELRIHLTES